MIHRIRIVFPGHRGCTVFLLLFGVLLGGCKTSRNNASHTAPAVEFISVPVAGAGNPAKVSTIKGRAIGAQPGQRIVLYAKGETTWWVQPFADQPFTKIQSNSRWQNSTHPGTEYAALLVEPGFQPPLTTDALPTQGVVAFAVTHGEPALWRRWWFPFACVMVAMLTIVALYRLRLHQLTRKLNFRFEERLAERMRVAQELHDTLLQGVLSASMHLHVAVDQLPPESPARPALNRVLQLMGQVIEEGRNTVRGLRSSRDGVHDLEQEFLHILQELGSDEKIGFRVIVEGAPLPLYPGIRNEVYSIGREALLNAFRHSRASSIEVALEYAVNNMRVLVRDNGCGIDPQILNVGRDGHWGLSGMRERAERIGARVKVWSRISGGTEVELSVPGRIAFESNPSGRVSKWLARLYARKTEANTAEAGKRVG